MREILKKIMGGEDLSQNEASVCFEKLMAGELTAAQTGALLATLRMKGESVAEISGAAESMRRNAVRIDVGGLAVIDTCGTGGDNTGTFNISTAAALVVAGAGVPVAKHGNRAVTSLCGSADVLTALGVNVEAPADVMEECIREAGLGFLFAPNCHPAMRNVAGARREMGVRTIFNMLGPLTNPAGARAQLLGVFAPELTELFARVLRNLGSRRVMIVHGSDGMDEITVTGTTRITELKDGNLRTYEFDPLPFIEDYYELEDLRGGEPAENARIINEIIEGKAGAGREIVVLNAAAGIMIGGQADDWQSAVAKARAVLDDGRARNVLKKLVAITCADV